MNTIILTAFLLSPVISFSQVSTSVSVIDFVKIKNGKQAEAIFFYQNNWKVYREKALAKNFIKSYRMLSVIPDSTESFDLMLITEYRDSAYLNAGEARFQEIIRELRPNGPKLLNDLKPNEFRENLFFKKTETLVSSN